MKFCSVVLAAAPIVSVGLYQEDVAVVTRAVTPKDGSALVRVGAHEPFGGSFWYTSKTPLALAGEKATLFMSGELINDLGDWNETEVSLISGKCNVARDGRPGGFGSHKRKMTNASYELKCAAVESPSADGYRSAADEGAGDDVHYRSLGKVSLKCRESLSVPLGAEKVDVKRLVEWTAAGLWDAVKFKNPFKFPMASGKIDLEAGETREFRVECARWFAM